MIVFDQVTRTFGEKIAVDCLNMTVPTGAMFGFLGPNGAGKTTSLRLLMGLLQPTSGKATIDGLDVTTETLQVRSRVGYLPDEVFLYDYLSGRQFLEFIGDVHQLPREVRDERIAHYLRFFQLEEAADDFTANYSFGMKKKLALASIVLHRPRVLLLDEPFNGLDPQAVRDFRELLQAMRAEGVTIVFSSHVLEVVEKLVTHVGIIARGKLRAIGTLDAIVKPYDNHLEKAFFSLIES